PQGPIRSYPEAGNVVNLPNVPAGVEDIQQVIVQRQTNRSEATRGNGLEVLEPFGMHLKTGYLMAPGVDNEQPTPALIQHHRALVAQASASAKPTRSKHTGRLQPAGTSALEDQYVIAIRGVAHGIHSTHEFHCLRSSHPQTDGE